MEIRGIYTEVITKMHKFAYNKIIFYIRWRERERLATLKEIVLDIGMGYK